MHISDIDGLADCHMDCDSLTTVGCTEDLAQHDKGIYKFVQVCFPKICATIRKKHYYIPKHRHIFIYSLIIHVCTYVQDRCLTYYDFMKKQIHSIKLIIQWMMFIWNWRMRR